MKNKLKFTYSLLYIQSVPWAGRFYWTWSNAEYEFSQQFCKTVFFNFIAKIKPNLTFFWTWPLRYLFIYLLLIVDMFCLLEYIFNMLFPLISFSIYFHKTGEWLFSSSRNRTFLKGVAHATKGRSCLYYEWYGVKFLMSQIKFWISDSLICLKNVFLYFVHKPTILFWYPVYSYK